MAGGDGGLTANGIADRTALERHRDARDRAADAIAWGVVEIEQPDLNSDEGSFSPEDLADAVLDDAGDEIGSAAGRERHNHHDWSIGIVAGVLGGGSCAKQKEQCAAERRR